MAEAAGTQTPSFKLVLVGDGGTGKVCLPYILQSPYRQLASPFPLGG